MRRVHRTLRALTACPFLIHTTTIAFFMFLLLATNQTNFGWLGNSFPAVFSKRELPLFLGILSLLAPLAMVLTCRKKYTSRSVYCLRIMCYVIGALLGLNVPLYTWRSWSRLVAAQVSLLYEVYGGWMSAMIAQGLLAYALFLPTVFPPLKTALRSVASVPREVFSHSTNRDPHFEFR